jgi:PKD repeat protein
MNITAIRFVIAALIIGACGLCAKLSSQVVKGTDGIVAAFAERGEVSFCFNIQSPKELDVLSRIISIDRVDGDRVYAYANRKEMEAFIRMGYTARLVEQEPATGIEMADIEQIRNIDDWDYYPTYDAYVQMMYDFQDNYPDLCKVVTIGTLPSGRKLLAARISDNILTNESEPQFLYTSSMHGNETTGYILMLRLIDHLLTNYSLEPAITDLLDHLEIWINPLANPDGTYAGGNNSVAGATRYNANDVDLNRNYPDPEDGPHPDGNEWQPETIAFMDLASAHDFAMGANFHGGTELVNYPWDTWEQRHADDSWWQYVSYQYADTVHAYSNNYFYGEGDGVTNGYDWYTISGGRQDYMTYFHHGRECTIELSDISLLPASQLPALWEYNYRSLLNYLEQALNGINGLVTDSITGGGIKAKIEIEGHDADSSHVYSSLPGGKYQRLIYEGSYELTVKSSGYFPKVIPNVAVVNGQSNVLDIELVPGDLVAVFCVNDREVPVNSPVQFMDESFGSIQSWYWEFEGGTPALSSEQFPTVVYHAPGEFDVTLTITGPDGFSTWKRENYMDVTLEYLMVNGTVTVCSGKFYDSGGQAANYGNGQNLVMTFAPDGPDKRISIEFTEFNVEDDPTCDYDYLRIYDGPGTTYPLLGEYCGTDSPGTVNATNESGALTFFFHSDGNVTAQGWEADIQCEDYVGVAADPPGNAILVYPNPAGNLVRISCETCMQGDVNFTLFSENGSVAFKHNEFVISKQIELTIPSLASGVYYLQISDGNQNFFKKIIID